jgi:Fanconi anemia group M protein
MIKNFKPRLYQETIFASASRQNTLVVLPTGLGKTNIFLMLAAHRLNQYPNSKILLIGPTRPLIDQYYRVFEQHFEIDKEQMAIFTGNISPEKRAIMWKNAKIIFSTPQGLENDVISNKIRLEEVSLLGVDEAHRAVGDYAYVYIAKEYEKRANYPRIIGLTASPGSELIKIEEVIKNLFIENIEIRTDDDHDVKQYVQEVQTRWVSVDFPDEFKEVHKHLADCYKSKLDEIKKLNIVKDVGKFSDSKKDILDLQAALQGEIAQGNRDFSILKAISFAAEALKIQHAIELIETQGVSSLSLYLEDINSSATTSKVKAVQNLSIDTNFRAALVKTRILIEKNLEHPKLAMLKKLLKEHIILPDYKVIVFTQYRDTGSKIIEELAKEKITAELFIGQANKRANGLSQKKQIEMLQRFRNNEFHALVSSSVGEEGLDVPQVDLVLFYEPIPSAIRHIQRRGRTGRQGRGEVIILMTKGTRDEGYRWSAHHKENRMYTLLKSVKNKLHFYKFADEKQKSSAENKNTKLQDYTIGKEERIKIFVDHREKGSGVMKSLLSHDVDLKLETLNSADYILSSRCGIEYKTNEDFVDSLIDGRLIQQVKELKNNFLRPLIIVEGNVDIYSIRNIHPNAIRGLIAMITVTYGIPLIYTRTANETAEMFIAIAKHEQEEYGRDFSPHANRKKTTLKEQQEYIISALPGVGMGLSKSLLKRFGSVRSVVNSTEDELKETEKIGEKKAKTIRDAIDSRYN